MNIQNLVREKVIGNIKTGTKNANGLPQKLSYFNVEEDKGTSNDMVEIFKQLYPNKPTKLRIRFTSENPFNFKFKRYINGKAVCIGNGTKAITIGKDAKNNNTQIEVECSEDCEHLRNGRCKLKGSLKFILDGIDAGGVWNLSTTGGISLSNIASEIVKYKSLGESIVNIPFDLTLSEQQSLAYGTYYSIDLHRADSKPQLVNNSRPMLQQENNAEIKQLEENLQEQPTNKVSKKTSSKTKVQSAEEKAEVPANEKNQNSNDSEQDASSNYLIVKSFMPTLIQGQKFDKVTLETVNGGTVEYILHPKANQEILKFGAGTVIDVETTKTEMDRNILCKYTIKQIIGPDGSWIEYKEEELKKAV